MSQHYPKGNDIENASPKQFREWVDNLRPPRNQLEEVALSCIKRRLNNSEEIVEKSSEEEASVDED